MDTMTRSARTLVTLALCALVFPGCDDGGGTESTGDATPSSDLTDATFGDTIATTAPDATGSDADATATDSGDAIDSPDVPADPDPDRWGVIAKPFGADGPAPVFEVFALERDGSLSLPGVTFELGDRAPYGRIAFSSDGRVGAVALDDGSVGVFALSEVSGSPVVDVLAAGYTDGFYADTVAMGPGDDHLLVGDANTVENGGGIFRIALDSNGTPVSTTRLVEAANVRSLMPVAPAAPGSDDRWLVGARSVGASTVGHDVHLVRIDSDSATWLAGVDAFGDDDGIVDDIAVTWDQRFALVTDTSFVVSPHRAAVVGLDLATNTLSATGMLSPFGDPIAALASPLADSALVVGLQENALWHLSYAPMAAMPFEIVGEITYTGGTPQLPADAVLVPDAPIEGLVVLGENTAIRRARFVAGGVEDLGPFDLGEGSEAISGAIGIQPVSR